MTDRFTTTFQAAQNWQQSAKPTRPYRMAELRDALDSDAVTIALALRIIGWTRDRVRSTFGPRRTLVSYWVPPNGRPHPRRRPGRPSFADLLASAP